MRQNLGSFTDPVTSEAEGIPPVILILVLFGFGVLGLVITSIALHESWENA
ncbi:MAG UNVERIFIED_CONTAM: hypothetical protein LVT10_24040 [Anaerolineae bacterium]|jgi:hypothetical protein